MISALRKTLFRNSAKNRSAPHILIVLCVYAVINTIYTLLFFGFDAMLVRMVLSLIIVVSYIVIEQSPLGSAATAFAASVTIIAVLIVGAIYFKGDFLLFTYNCGIAMIVLTYLKPKSLAAYISVSSAAFAVILFAFGINLLGPAFTAVYNILYYVTSVAINLLVYVFCKSYVQALADLIETKNEANLASQAKGAFLANMSHEIRTPLNAVIGLTEVELRRELPPDDLENLRKINASGKLLMGIINDILDMSKIESGKFDLNVSVYNFADMIYDTVVLNIVRLGTKPIVFTVSVSEDIPCRLKGDELRVKQLLSNMLSNAFKYTFEGRVELRASCRTEAGYTRLTLEVDDTGIGIKENDLKKLFSEYAQVNQSSTRGIEGTGLGLPICKGLAELMGGQMSVRSEYGKGSVFSVEILQEVIDAAHIGPQISASLRDSTYIPQFSADNIKFIQMPYARVLVVDDVDLNLEVAAACMEPYEMQVDCTDSGADAVRRIRDEEPKYDLVFMDHMMPVMDGIETTKAIREIGTQYAGSVPIIALTANAFSGNEKMFADNGFQGFLPKPIEPEKLDEVLMKWVYDPGFSQNVRES